MLHLLIVGLLASQAIAGPTEIQQRSLERIIGGHVADPGEYPGMASLIYFGEHMCGCSIVNEKYVLTAAHCTEVMLPTSFAINVGSNHITSGMKFYDVGRLHAHEGYDNSDMSSPDLAVLAIKGTFIFSSLIMPVTLPAQDVSSPAGSAAIAIGWGFTANVGPFSPNLLEVDLVIRDQAQCASIYASDVALTTAQICADVPEGGKGFCNGDFGSPLFVNGAVHGLASWSGNGCATEGFPGVYTRVASFRDWIDANTAL